MKKIGKKNLYRVVEALSVVEYLAQRRPYTCAQLKMVAVGYAYTGVGFSKVCWPDEWSSTYGINEAIRRATRDSCKAILAEPGREAIYDAMLDVLERHDQLSVLE